MQSQGSHKFRPTLRQPAHPVLFGSATGCIHSKLLLLYHLVRYRNPILAQRFSQHFPSPSARFVTSCAAETTLGLPGSCPACSRLEYSMLTCCGEFDHLWREGGQTCHALIIRGRQPFAEANGHAQSSLHLWGIIGIKASRYKSIWFRSINVTAKVRQVYYSRHWRDGIRWRRIGVHLP